MNEDGLSNDEKLNILFKNYMNYNLKDKMIKKIFNYLLEWYSKYSFLSFNTCNTINVINTMLIIIVVFILQICTYSYRTILKYY